MCAPPGGNAGRRLEPPTPGGAGARGRRSPGPARPWGILGAGRGGGGSFKRRYGCRGRVAAGDWKPRSAPQRLACPAPAAAMAALPPPDEQDFIQAYEEVREKVQRYGGGPRPPLRAACRPRLAGLTGPPARQSGLAPRLRGRPDQAQTPGSPPASLDRRGRR